MLELTHVGLHLGRNHGGEHGLNGLLQVLPVQHLAALLVDDLTLGVHHVVVLQHGLAGLEVAGLHLLLGVLNGVGEDLRVNGGVLVHAQLLHHAHDPLGAEQAHDVVLQGQVEAALARVALTAGTAAELVVNAAGLVALGAQDEQAARGPHLVGLRLDLVLVFGLRLGEHLPGVEDLLVVGVGVAGGLGDELVGEAGLAQLGLGQVLGVAAQHDIGAAAGHVGGHGDRAQLAGLGDDLGLLLVELGVEHVVLDAPLLEHGGELLRLLDGDGAHQHGLALLVALLNLVDNGAELARLGLVNHVGVIHALHRLVGGDLHDIQGVDGAELLLLGHGGAGHAGELAVQAEVVLEGDGGQGLGLPGHGDALLGLNGLVQALGVPAAVHEAAGELVHDDDLAVLDHVVDVPAHQAPGPDGLVDVVGQGGVFRIGQVGHLELLLGLGDAPGGEGDGAGLLVHHVVGVQIGVLLLLGVHAGHPLALELGHKGVHYGVELGGLVPLTGDNEGGAGLVDEDGVHLIHDGEGVAPLHHLGGVDGHVVSQVVETELVVGAVGDVGGVGGLAVLGLDVVDHQAHGEAQEAVDLAHPLAVALGQVVVDGDDVHALSRQGVEVGGQGGHQGLALAGLHLGDAALVEDDAADELHPVGLHAQHAPGRLPAGGEGLGQDVVQTLAIGDALLEFGGLGLELLVGELGVLPVQGFNLVHDGFDGAELLLGAGAKELFQQSHASCSPFLFLSPAPRLPGLGC